MNGTPSRRLVAAVACALFACGRAESVPPRLSVDVTFRSVWWSEAQMEGMNPNAPPPKTTEVVLEQWEYTDPIGVPHPDSVDVVIALTNEGVKAVDRVVVTVTGEWRVGPKGTDANAVWREAEPLQTFASVTVAPGKATVLRVPVDLAARMTALEASDSWPWAFRVVVTVRVDGASDPLMRYEKVLPIRPGD